MVYEPLHHKYRPQTFGQLVGQPAIATTLANALRQRRIAPAYLFCGPRGTGKTSSARILAKSLNCLSSTVPTPDPCGQCQVCQEITTGSALDIVEIDAASNTGVDNIRELIERAQFAPVQCRYKLYVLDEVHMLSTAAFNALLKTLEEPPERVVFVLATTDPQRVLPTIISRCQRFDFRRIPLSEMVQHLTQIAAQESITITPEALLLVAQLSQGGLRDAESLLDQLSLMEGEVTAEAVWDLVGAVPERDLLALARAIAADDSAQVLTQARQLMDRGREPLVVLQSLVGFYRDLLIAKTAGNRQDLVTVTAPTWAEMGEFVQALSVPLLLAGQQQLRAAEGQVKQTTQPRLWLEITLLGLLPSAHAVALNAAAPPAKSPTAKSHPTVVQPPPASTASAQVAPPSPMPSSPAPPEPAAPASPAEAVSPAAPARPAPVKPNPAMGSMSDIWAQIIQQLHPLGTKALMGQQGQLLEFDGVEARVGIRSQQLMRMAHERLSNLEAAFAKVFGHTVKVALEVMAEPTAASRDTSPVPSPPPIVSPSEPASSPGPLPGPAAGLPEPMMVQAPEAEPSTCLAPPEPSQQPSWDVESDFERSVKSFAQFFNGQIVNFDAEDLPEPGRPPNPRPPRTPQSSQPGPDVPF